MTASLGMNLKNAAEFTTEFTDWTDEGIYPVRMRPDLIPFTVKDQEIGNV